LRALQDGIRRRAVDRLGLTPGSTVIDVGCGTGLSFPLLVDAVGPAGHVIGIDQSEGMLAVARARIASAGWPNVELNRAPAGQALPADAVDAALLFFTHDILRTPSALDNVVTIVRPHGRVVTAGIRQPSRLLSPIALLVARRYVTTFEGLAAPWDLLALRLDDMHVELWGLRLAYVATGVVPAHRSGADERERR
jgi:demethylmenaquinone methyltransferase/2-methoxy-6-polyprenyl-1,4-benzoquinol methylase